MKTLYTSLYIFGFVLLSHAQSTTVFFTSGSSFITEDSKMVLQKIWDENKSQITAVSIKGYADTVGTAASNQKLSEQRAQAILKWFVNNGFPRKLLSASGKGEVNDRSVFSENRRCEIELTLLPSPPQIGSLTIVFTITDNETGEPLPADVQFMHIEKVQFETLPASGKQSYTLESGQNYSWEFSMEGYASRVFDFNPSDYISRGRTEFTAGISLVPQKVLRKMVVDDIYFVGNKAEFLKTSMPGLEKLYQELLKVPNSKIEIHGHVNYPAPYIPTREKEEELMDLSVQRAKAVFTFLVNKGIDAERMRFKGFGHHKMLYPNAILEAEQEKNRRVEILILE